MLYKSVISDNILVKKVLGRLNLLMCYKHIGLVGRDGRMRASPLLVLSYCQSLSFERITVCELEGFGTIFDCECLAGCWLWWERYSGPLGFYWSLRRALLLGVCEKMRTLCCKS